MTQRLPGAAIVLVLLSTGSAGAADLEPLIEKAVERGVAFLRTEQAQNALTTSSQFPLGGMALTGLAMLECGVRTDDAVVQRIASKVREGAVTADKTYILSLSIMLLDRLNDPADIPLIESMAVRLLAGQNLRGGWTYDCPVSREDSEIRRLTATVLQRPKLDPDHPLPRRRRDVVHESRRISKEIEEQLKFVSQHPRVDGGDDNSNTQFATLALWVASRYDLPVDDALARVEDRFRLFQNADGGWSYTGGPHQSHSTTSMTCAGLLGLAIGHGVRAAPDSKLAPVNQRKAVQLAKDPAVLAGLQILSTAIGVPGGIVPRELVASQNPTYDYYFLWSLERVAVAYGLNTIGRKDWYRWGAELLLSSQDPTGSWGNGGADTSFALLFLRRSNFAEDLTRTLRGRMNDPGEVTMRSGGVGGAGIKRYALRPGDNPSAKARNPGSAQPVDEPRKLPALDAEVAPLVQEVLQADDKRQTELIVQYQESWGVLYTQALAAIIHRLDGAPKTAARDALAERLYRMTPQTLRDKLKDDDQEVRSAAALACEMKKDTQYVPDLIPCLEDMDRRVARAAYLALKSITKQDFGPAATANAEDRTKATAAWKEWWKKQNP